ncbi:TPA: DNA cytosine methyltransferase [Stenotrophomonas maltophilia]|nr:DNA cytosine methyltransferase [Stenotrophomonas maltophilia]HDS1025259.1 DNA cytosine methyltransferase [Stenotrophomonas maltophilia]HDS1029512.1 DNA cytosine methyltransferase [Stenotrophomonas maltophilia]HDS1034130.1 DNA cytosine methyltransferase [Stenotrophomonas maltophilia]
MERKLTAIDLFSGCGGLTLGLRSAGFEVVAAVEIDRKAAETYRANHPQVPLIESDIRSVSSEHLLAKADLTKGELDLLAGCPPCQGFSTMRSKNGKAPADDPRNGLIDDFSRLAIQLRPKMVMMENVPALANYPKFQDFVCRLRAAGYEVVHSVVDVGDYEVPQRRRRLILVASRISTPTLAAASSARRSVRDAIGHLSSPGSTGDELHDRTASRRTARVQAIIEAIPKDGGSRSSLPENLKLKCHNSTSGFNDVYGRMAWDHQAPTITGGCNNPSRGRFIHPSDDRVISLREAAMLQGFPGDYIFSLSHGKESLALMIGNALPPKFIEMQGLEMRRNLSGVKDKAAD